MPAPICFQNNQSRVQHGQCRERQILKALKEQAGLDVKPADHQADCESKIDAWLNHQGQSFGVQVKYRETGEDILFEVFDRFLGFDEVNNKLGRDMRGQADIYACLTEKNTCFLVRCEDIKRIVNAMLEMVRNHGWTIKGQRSSTFRFHDGGVTLELKLQADPRDGRQKMCAYLPPAWFKAKAQLREFQIKLPKKW